MTSYVCRRAFGHLAPGDLVDLDGMPDPSYFELVEVVVDDPDLPDEPEAPWWAS